MLPCCRTYYATCCHSTTSKPLDTVKACGSSDTGRPYRANLAVAVNQGKPGEQYVGGRHADCAYAFIADLARRKGRTQLTCDGHKADLKAVEDAFGADVDYAMLVKLYGPSIGTQQERRYNAGGCCGAIKGTICGNPDEKHMSTSFVERQNLSLRMGNRRFTRLTNGFRKKAENHAHALAIYYVHYNFGHIHKTLRVTPAMEAKVSDHVWSLEEIAKLAD